MSRIGILCLAVCMLSACKEKNSSSSAPPPTSVASEIVSARSLPTYLSLPGTTASVQQVEVQARVEGWLTERHFQEGQFVFEGDLLYEIDATQFTAQLLQAEALLASAIAEETYAQKEFDRNEPLVKTGAISKQDFDKLETQLEQALAQVAQAESGVVIADLNVEYCSVYAPISGKIGATAVDVGALVGPGKQASLANITQISPMYVELHPPANRLVIIQSLMKKDVLPMQITMSENASEGQASVESSEITKHKVTGSLVFVDNSIKSTTSTFLARGEFINDLGVLPGQYVGVRLQLQVIEKAVMVPLKAVMQQPGSYFVWTISEENTAVITPVTVGAIQGSYQHVLTGLNDGEEVIVEGATNLRSGAQIVITNATSEKE